MVVFLRVASIAALAAVLAALPGRAEADMAGGRAALHKGDYAAAERAFRAVKGGPDRGPALVGLARTLLETGRYADAARVGADATRAGARADGEATRAEALYATGDRAGAVAALRPLTSDPAALRARLLFGRYQQEAGEDADARVVFDAFIDDYNADRITAQNGEGLAYVAEAAARLGAYRDANEAFQQATAADAKRVETQVEWARLFLTKYDAGHAEESLRVALAENPNHAEAHLLYARVKMEQSYDFVAANDHLEKALGTNPNLTAAYAMRAELALMDQDDAAADRHLTAARRVNPKDLDTLSVAAAAKYLVDDTAGFERTKRDVLTRSPRASPLWELLARFGDWEHRYAEVIPLMEEALRIDPAHPTALGHIGLNQLRMGDETRGLETLKRSWERDRYNVVVYNTLNFYEEVIEKEYEIVEDGPRRLRFHKDERPVLERYVPPMLAKAWRTMTKRYGFEPQGPVQIELYADQEHFALRTSGQPDIGVQGVCFGKVVTALSPSGGPFNWGQILWHELAHVFSIQLSRSRVPRWFTEGLAEYETIIARPEWVRENDDDLYRAIESGHLPPIAELNNAFTHARSGDEVLVAYYAASQVVKYIVERFGFEKAVSMLRLWGRGKRTPAVVREALGIDVATLDRDFRRATLERIGDRYRQNFRVAYVWADDVDVARAAAQAAPGDVGKQLALGLALVRAGELDEAARVLASVLQTEPRNRAALFAASDVALAKRDYAATVAHARALLATGTDSYEMRINLALSAKAANDEAEYGRQICFATRVDPQQPEAQARLAAWLETRGRTPQALARLREVVRLDQHDREAMASFLPKLRAGDRWADLIEFGERALYLDPLNPEVHRLLGEAYEHANRRDDALFEYESALRCKPQDPAPIQNAIDRLRGRARRRI